jgi:hypothetical protein
MLSLNIETLTKETRGATLANRPQPMTAVTANLVSTVG